MSKREDEDTVLFKYVMRSVKLSLLFDPNEIIACDKNAKRQQIFAILGGYECLPSAQTSLAGHDRARV